MHAFKTDAIALASPSGRMSKRALLAAQERIRRELFPEGLQAPTATQPTEREHDLRLADEYETLAARGMKPRTHRRLATALRAKWEAV